MNARTLQSSVVCAALAGGEGGAVGRVWVLAPKYQRLTHRLLLRGSILKLSPQAVSRGSVG